VDRPDRLATVAQHVACWDDEAQFIPVDQLYVWGLVNYGNGGNDVGLVLLLIGFDGEVRAMVPVMRGGDS
jgi:hypothetical protein